MESKRVCFHFEISLHTIWGGASLIYEPYSFSNNVIISIVWCSFGHILLYGLKCFSGYSFTLELFFSRLLRTWVPPGSPLLCVEGQCSVPYVVSGPGRAGSTRYQVYLHCVGIYYGCFPSSHLQSQLLTHDLITVRTFSFLIFPFPNQV